MSTQSEIRKAEPEDGPAQPFAYVAQSRIPLMPQGYVLSPDDRWLTMPLKDAGTTNIWALPTNGGPARQLTDFGQRPILIARQGFVVTGRRVRLRCGRRDRRRHRCCWMRVLALGPAPLRSLDFEMSVRGENVLRRDDSIRSV